MSSSFSDLLKILILKFSKIIEIQIDFDTPMLKTLFSQRINYYPINFW